MTARISLPDQDETHRLGDLLAAQAVPGLTVLLDGPVGAGKTTLARRIIQNLLSQDGRNEDVPSPTFTIVQTYETSSLEIWHADLYRLTSTLEAGELGLDAAFDTAFCLIEWPDRLGDTFPEGLRIDLAHGAQEGERLAAISSTSAKFARHAHDLAGAFQS